MRTRRRAHPGFALPFVFLAGPLLALGVSVPAWAADPNHGSACPLPGAVAIATQALIGPLPREHGADPRITIRDLGDRFAVTVRNETREFTDSARDCDTRARTAAVFAALVLSPAFVMAPAARAETWSPDTGGEASPPPPRPPPAPPAKPPFEGTDVELGATGGMAPRADGPQFTLAAELRVVVTRGGWGIALGGASPASSTINLQAARVREIRTPVDLGIRRGWTVGWFRTGIELGALAAICRFQQMDRMNTEAMTRIELGLRAAATISADSPRVGIYLRVHSDFIPVTHEIAVQPLGVIGRSSALWTGASVGLVARFH